MRDLFPHLFYDEDPPAWDSEEDPPGEPEPEPEPLLLRRLRRQAKQKPFHTPKDERTMSRQISSVLNQLFNNSYDEQIRPQLGRNPLIVTVNINIRSMGPVDERRQEFSLDCYFRQYWRDERLRYGIVWFFFLFKCVCFFLGKRKFEISVGCCRFS